MGPRWPTRGWFDPPEQSGGSGQGGADRSGADRSDTDRAGSDRGRPGGSGRRGSGGFGSGNSRSNGFGSGGSGSGRSGSGRSRGGTAGARRGSGFGRGGPGAVHDEETGADSGADNGPDTGTETKDPVASAHAAALRLLTVRAHSRAEILQRLVRRGFEPDPVEAALDRLERAGLLDDAAFAAELAASRTRRGYAASVVERDLRARGVERGTADEAAAAASPPDQEAERCTALAAEWAARHDGLDPRTAARRLAGYLARRGYTAGVVAAAVSSNIDLSSTDSLDGDPEDDDDQAGPD
jgi:regulatory protein